MASEQPAEPPAAAAAAPAASPPAAPAGQEETTTATDTTGILPAEHWVQAARDAADDGDTDSALGDDAASSTASISSTILQYRKIHGRTFHGEVGDAQYW
ncbi:uncharacterized protein ColSpa_05181 [Colletotrichum spaethianum]|uniref:Uncharacterized protein n=1 Tax=Colletotrichum spaethianum TaxID=700344 RepID=A0AA37LED5_9PEZI|nr:uncharacterized protein ColSpa_05181 [Colletotrichum spaethianum]GKT45000.1 hypothetical protein ColSpa_05181 [Colletotrichum spaethianum]